VDLPRPRARLLGVLGAAWGLTGAGHLAGKSARAEAAEARGVRLALPATGLPFSPADLELAVQARLTLVRGDGPATPVVIAPSPATGTVVVTSARRLEEVTVAGKSATEAARLVALAVVAVVRPAAIDSAASFAGETTGLADQSRDGHPAPGRERWSVGAATGVSLGLRDGGVTFEPLIEGAWSWGAPAGAAPGGAGPWQIALGLGFARAQVAWSDRDLRGNFVLDTFPVRVGLRRRWQFLTVGAGPVVRLFRTSGLDGGGGAVAGGYASVGTDLALGGGLRATVTLSGDVDSQRLVFRAAGMELLTAGPFIPWLGVGLRWGAS
jgi:hypothetical protein